MADLLAECAHRNGKGFLLVVRILLKTAADQKKICRCRKIANTAVKKVEGLP